MVKPKEKNARVKLNATISRVLCEFLDYLMIRKDMNKSAVVDRLIRTGINSLPDVSDMYSEYMLLISDNLPFEDDENDDKTKKKMKKK